MNAHSKEIAKYVDKGFFDRNWKKNLAKAIINHYGEENKPLSDIEEDVSQYGDHESYVKEVINSAGGVIPDAHKMDVDVQVFHWVEVDHTHKTTIGKLKSIAWMADALLDFWWDTFVVIKDLSTMSDVMFSTVDNTLFMFIHTSVPEEKPYGYVLEEHGVNPSLLSVDRFDGIQLVDGRWPFSPVEQSDEEMQEMRMALERVQPFL